MLYGAAEFSYARDVALLCTDDNLERLRGALRKLRAQGIAVTPFELHYLARGRAVHFRSQHPEAAGMRLDVMARVRVSTSVAAARPTDLARTEASLAEEGAVENAADRVYWAPLQAELETLRRPARDRS